MCTARLWANGNDFGLQHNINSAFGSWIKPLDGRTPHKLMADDPIERSTRQNFLMPLGQEPRCHPHLALDRPGSDTVHQILKRGRAEGNFRQMKRH